MKSLNTDAIGRNVRTGGTPASEPLEPRRRSTRCWIPLIPLLTLLLSCAGPGRSWAQGFSEPSTIFYGRVVQINAGSSFQLFEGTLRMTFVSTINSANVVTLETTLAPTGQGGGFSYSLEVPQKYLPREVELNTVLNTGATPTSFRFRGLSVNGVDAFPLNEATQVFTTSFKDRAQQYRFDVRVTLPQTDTDRDSMPDWFENRYGLNANFTGDAGQDSDGDGLTNLEEFRAGTDPRESNAAPQLRTTRIRVPDLGKAGLLLDLIDSDTSPQNVSLRIGKLTVGFGLLKEGVPLREGSSFSLADVAAGRLVITHTNRSRTTGNLTLHYQDLNHPLAEANLELLTDQPTTRDGSDAGLWLDAYQTTLKSGDRLGEWRDMSGNNRHAWQPQADLKPVYVVNSDGKPGADFKGRERHLLLDETSLDSEQLTFFAVFDAPVTGGTEQLVGANRMMAAVQPSGGRVSYPGAISFSRDGRMVRGRFDTRGQRVVSSVTFRNDQAFATTLDRFDGVGQPMDSSEPPVEPAIGLLREYVDATRSNPMNSFQGRIRELLVYPRALDASRRQRISDYLESKWLSSVLWDWSAEGVPVNVQGTAGRDIIRGGWGSDVLKGGDGDDWIAGGPCDDFLTGGTGSDTFSYSIIDTGIDVITDFDPTGPDHDVLDLSELFVGKKGDVRDYVRLRVESVREGNGLILRTLIQVRQSLESAGWPYSITLRGAAFSQADLPMLVSEGVIAAGDLAVPVSVDIAALPTVQTVGETFPLIRLSRNGDTSGALEVPLFLSGLAEPGTGLDYTLEGLAGTRDRKVVSFGRGEKEKTLTVVVRSPAGGSDHTLARVEILPRNEFTITRAVAEVVLAGGQATPSYDAWVVQVFGGPVDGSAPESDFDGDGVNNLTEYAFGTSPKDPASLVSNPLQVALVEGFLEIRLRTPSQGDRVDFQLMRRGLLTDPEEAVTAEFHESRVVTVGNSTETILRSLVPANELPAANYYRLRLTLKAPGVASTAR